MCLYCHRIDIYFNHYLRVRSAAGGVLLGGALLKSSQPRGASGVVVDAINVQWHAHAVDRIGQVADRELRGAALRGRSLGGGQSHEAGSDENGEQELHVCCEVVGCCMRND